MDRTPRGEERKVAGTGGIAIDGAPIAYVIVWAAIVAVLSFIPIPISVVLGIGSTFPLSQTVYPLAGIILGPGAGALAAGIGRLVGVLSAPYTSTGLLSVLVAVVAAAAGGLLVQHRSRLWVAMVALFGAALASYIAMGLGNGVSLRLAIASTWPNWLGLLLWFLPTRALARKWITRHEATALTAGLLLACWIVNTSSYTLPNAMFYPIFRWPAAQWAALTLIAPVEHLFRSIVGAVIGAGIITGLRAIGLVKPTQAGY